MKRNSNAITNRVKITVLVADDHPVVRHGIIANLKLQQDMLVVVEYSDGIEAIKLIKEHLPDVVLLGLRTPEATLKAFADHGQLGSIMPADGGGSEAILSQFRKAGVNLAALVAQLQNEGAKSFVKSWNEWIAVVASKSDALKQAA